MNQIKINWYRFPFSNLNNRGYTRLKITKNKRDPGIDICWEVRAYFGARNKNLGYILFMNGQSVSLAKRAATLMKRAEKLATRMGHVRGKAGIL